MRRWNDWPSAKEGDEGWSLVWMSHANHKAISVPPIGSSFSIVLAIGTSASRGLQCVLLERTAAWIHNYNANASGNHWLVRLLECGVAVGEFLLLSKPFLHSRSLPRHCPIFASSLKAKSSSNSSSVVRTREAIKVKIGVFICRSMTCTHAAMCQQSTPTLNPFLGRTMGK